MVEKSDRDELKEVQGRNLILFPPEKVASIARELSLDLSERFETSFILNTTNRVPHITIYQANYSINNLEKIGNQLKNFVKEVKPFRVRMGSFSSLAEFVFWNAEITDELQNFHERAVNLLNPIRERHEDNSDLDLVGITQGQRRSFEHYGTILAYKEFLPHITLTRLRNYSDAEAAIKLLSRRTAEFLVDRFCLATIGQDGTATEILEEYRF